MGCRSYRSALSEAAAGTLAPERRRVLDGHLAECGECAARIDRLQRARVLIHRAFSESAAVEPSSEWLRRIESQLQTEAETSRLRISYGIPAAAAVAIILAVAAWALLGRHAVPPHQAPVTAAIQPVRQPAPARPEIAAPAGEPTASRPTRSAAASRARVQRQMARRRRPRPNQRIFELVRVQPEREAVNRLYDLLQSGKVDPRSLLKPAQSVEKPIVIAPLRIKPLSIPPLETRGDSSDLQGQRSEARMNKETKP
jgi:type IV secretory pathway VirB10-like protein